MVKRLHYWLYGFLCLHIAVWTLAPVLVRYNLPMDALEGTIWGHTLDWGYDKNPFMNAWLTAIAVKWDHSGWMTYLFSQLSVGVCFWAIWQLGRKIAPPIYAVIAVFLLEGIQYYNFHAIDFNDNTLELGFWALTILFFYQAVREKKSFSWIFTGLFAGLSMMTKYYAVVLLLPMLLFLFIDPQARKSFKSWSFYFGLMIFFLVMTPHFIWLFSHNFITVDYAVDRVSNPLKWKAHFYFPILFSWQTFEALLPASVLLAFLMLGKAVKRTQEKIISLPDKTFLLLIGLGPFVLTILLSAIAGMKLRAAWGQPILSLSGLLLLLYLRPIITAKQFYRFAIVVFLGMAFAVTGYSLALMRANNPSSANFPGQEIATTLTTTWHEKFNSPVPYVAGIRWLAGNVAFYSADKPAVYIDWNQEVSSWVNENQLRQTGAIFVWDLSERDNIPFDEIKKRFPEMGKPHLMQFAWLRNPAMAPVRIIVAYLPPNKSLAAKSTSSCVVKRPNENRAEQCAA